MSARENFVVSVSRQTMKRTSVIVTIVKTGFVLSAKEYVFVLDVSDKIQWHSWKHTSLP